MKKDRYTMLEVARKFGVTKMAVYYQVRKRRLMGYFENDILYLTKKDINSLHFRDKNKKPYQRRKQ